MIKARGVSINRERLNERKGKRAKEGESERHAPFMNKVLANRELPLGMKERHHRTRALMGLGGTFEMQDIIDSGCTTGANTPQGILLS